MDTAISLHSTVITAADQVCSRLGKETVILELKQGAYYRLNSVGSVVWEMIQQPKSIESVYCSLLAEYEIDAETCKQDLLALITELQVAGLVKLVDSAA
jgi:Coenzyme PQQ synthesis protein D (PqqD)